MAEEKTLEGPSITISVKTLDGRLLKKTVLELKELLYPQCNLPATAQRLIFKGKVLKDELTLASYAIDEGFALHLVERPPGAPAPTAAGATQTAPRAAPQAVRPGMPSQGGFAPTVLIGSINLPPGAIPDISGMINAAASTSGPAGDAAATGVAALPSDPIDALRQSLDQLQSAIGRIPANPSAPPAASAAPAALPSTQLGHLAAQLRAVDASLQQLSPHLNRAAAILSQEATLTTPEQRQAAEQLLGSIGACLTALSQSTAHAGALASHTRLGDAVGKGSILPGAGRPRSSSISVSVPLFTMRRPDGSQAGAQQGTASVPAGGAPGGSAPAQPAQGGSLQSMQGLAPLFQMMGSLLRGAAGQGAATNVGAVGTATDGAHTAQGAANAADPMAGIIQMMGPAFQQLSQLQAAGGAAAPAPASASNSSTSPRTATAVVRAPQAVAAPSSSSVSNLPASAMPAAAAAPRSGAGSQTAVMMSHMYTQLLQDVPRLTQPGAPPITLQAFLSSMSNSPDAPPDPNDVLSQLMHVILDNLTLVELLDISAGNWGPMERLHQLLREQLLKIAAGSGAAAPAVTQPSAAQFAKLADNMVASMREAVAEEHLPANLKALILPGRELTNGSIRILRAKAEELLRLIAEPVPADSNGAFAESLRQWSVSLVQELVTYMSQSLRNGVHDVGDVLRFFLAERMSSMGEIAPLGSQLITSYVLNTFSSSLAPATGPAPPSPLPAPIDPDPASWAPMIAQDEVTQLNMAPQPPQSEAYRAGAPGAKKRKGRAPATPEAALGARVKAAGKRASKAKKGDKDKDKNKGDSGDETLSEVIANAATESPLLVELYKQLMDRSLKEREAKP